MNILELATQYLDRHILRPATEKIYLAAARACYKQFESLDVSRYQNDDVLIWRKQLLESGLSKRSWNTYANHLRTLFQFALEHGLIEIRQNPFKRTSVIPPRKKKKTVVHGAIEQARLWLNALEEEERTRCTRARVTPAWFWLTVFETFYHTGIRLNALLSIRLGDVDLDRQMILIRGELEKTHREFEVPIPRALQPHVATLVHAARSIGFQRLDQLFNVNRFSLYYRRVEMNADQVEAMYKKLTDITGTRMTPHRFRHTLASDLMKQPERNIHIAKALLNHSNIATTMEYIETDYEVIRDVLNEREEKRRPRRIMQNIDPTMQAPASQIESPRAAPMRALPNASPQVPPPQSGNRNPPRLSDHRHRARLASTPTREAPSAEDSPDLLESLETITSWLRLSLATHATVQERERGLSDLVTELRRQQSPQNSATQMGYKIRQRQL